MVKVAPPYEDIFISPEWCAVKKFYGEKKTARSKVPLINHIKEGLTVLEYLGSDFDTKAAFCLTPLFMDDENFKKSGKEFIARHGYRKTVMLAIEYRGLANAYLPEHTLPDTGIHISPLREVNHMLIAGKIQRRRDFEIHHKATHKRANRLEEYFDDWLRALSISKNKYKLIKEYLEC